MADIDVHGSRLQSRFQPRSEFVAQASFIEAINQSPHRSSQQILRYFRAVFRPIGFHDPGIRRFTLQHKTAISPELLDGRPRLIGRGFHDEPALFAGAFDSRAFDFGKHHVSCGRHVTAFPVIRRVGGGLGIGNNKAIIGYGRGQVRRNLQRWNLSPLRTIVGTFAGKKGPTTRQQQGQN